MPRRPKCDAQHERACKWATTSASECECTCRGKNHGVLHRKHRGVLRFAEEETSVSEPVPEEVLYRVSTADGKYTLIQHLDGRVELLRYNEPWVHRVDRHAKVLLMFASDLEEARGRIGELEAAQTVPFQ